MINSLINRASIFATEKHSRQLDDSHKPYILHCVRVACLLSLVTNDENIIAAGYLHDTLEDTDTTYEQLVSEFGKGVADLVNEVTHEGTKDSKGFYFPRLKSKSAIMIKFADRLDNLSRMEVWDNKRQLQYLAKSIFWKDE